MRAPNYLVVTLASCLAACGGGGGVSEPTQQTATVAVSPGPTIALVMGATSQLTATARDANGSALAGRSASWSSSANTVASVSTTGLVTAAGAGTAQIVAAIDGKTASVTVNVTPAPVASIDVTPGPGNTLLVGGQQQLVATPRDASGVALSGRAIQWTSTAPAVATVENGLVTAVAVGMATISAASEGVSASVSVQVDPIPVASLSLSMTAATLVPGQSQSLTGTPRDAQGNALTGRVVTWGSSATGVATVSDAGLVNAMSPGVATITGTSEGKSAAATITVVGGGFVNASGGTVTFGGGTVSVTIPAGAVSGGTAITVAPVADPTAHAALVAGTAFEFGPSGIPFASPVTIAIRYAPEAVGGSTPANFRLHRLTNGTWTPLPVSGVDTDTRTVTGETVTFSKYAVLFVMSPVASVSVSPPVATLDVGSTVALAATLRDATNTVLTDRDVTWSSSDDAIATVSALGVVTGVSPGSVTVTATSEGQAGAADITVNPPSPVPAGQIAFTSNRDGSYDIYIMNDDGSGVRRLTNHPADDSQPALSPDGTRIAFVSNRSGEYEIWVMNVDGSSPTQLTNVPEGSSTPAWSPDGSKIAFASARDPRIGFDPPPSRLWVMNADGTMQTQLTSGTSNGDFSPDWSPDGSKIAFNRSVLAGGELFRDIWIMNATGGNEVKLTNNPDNVLSRDAEWSPDGSKIAFTRRVALGYNHVYVINANGTAETQLTGDEEFGSRDPSWSPDGTRLAFTSARFNAADVFTMNPDGTGRVRLTTLSATDDEPDWGSVTSPRRSTLRKP